MLFNIRSRNTKGIKHFNYVSSILFITHILKSSSYVLKSYNSIKSTSNKKFASFRLTNDENVEQINCSNKVFSPRHLWPVNNLFLTWNFRQHRRSISSMWNTFFLTFCFSIFQKKTRERFTGTYSNHLNSFLWKPFVKICSSSIVLKLFI